MSSLSFTWTPRPEIFAQRLFAVANELDNLGPPLVAASEVLQADIHERFVTETDPQGRRWEDWSDNYRDYALNFPNVGILWQTGDLHDAAVSSEAITIRHDNVFYRTDALPHHGLAHDQGLEGMPQREFLGMSDEAVELAFVGFAEWFDGAVDLWVTPSGKIGRRHALQGPGGFVSRASTGRGPLT